VSIAQRERAALVDTMRTVGPEAPPVRWLNVRDLAAHLMIREYAWTHHRHPYPFFAAHTEKVQNDVASNRLDELLRKVASGPPVYSPLKLLDPVPMSARCSSITRTCVAPSRTGAACA